MDLKELYYDKANNLVERMLGEQPEDETPEEVEPLPGEEGEDEPVEPEGDDEQGQTEQVEIFFDSLDEETQKAVMDALRANLNVAPEDEYGNQRIIEALSNAPITILQAEELVRQLNIDL